MTTGKDTASFFENGSTEQFEFCLKLYPQVLKLKAEAKAKKPQELIRLDQWYQNELPKIIKGRGKDAHLVYDELVQTMKWKQARGKVFPQLSYLVKVNTPRAVIQETKKAFRKLPNLEQALNALSNLKGVGTTMASALLAAAAPDFAPFMADECLMAIPEIEGIDYTAKEYLNFVQHINTKVQRLNTQHGGETPFWSPHRVELALWAHYVANDLSPELLEDMPGSGSGGGISTNGSVSKNSLLNAEDTNDGDDESLTADGPSKANESETDNENTNPPHSTSGVNVALQDGDSNFVSNDSTSQEPMLDENTTQTTATTSTDGDIGTPLASDSESNLEAPQKITPLTGIVSPLKNNGTSANGNGTLTSIGDSLDGENSSCLRSLSTQDEASVEFDDESSNSNSRTADNLTDESKSLTPILNENTNANTDSTLSSLSNSLGQKRSLNCGGDALDDAANSQPEMKKIRSD